MSRNTRLAILAGASAAAMGSGFAGAAPVTVPNYSFETYNGDYYSSPTNWTTSYSLDPTYIGTPAQDLPGTDAGVTGEDQSRAGVLYFDDNNGSNATFSASNLFVMSNAASLGTFAANTTYTLNALYGASDRNTQYAVGYGLYSAPLTLATLNSTDSTYVTASTFPAASTLTVYPGASVVIDTATNPSLDNQPIYISLFVLDGYPYGRQALFDDVTLNATADSTPEPAALGIATAAIGALVLRRRRNALSPDRIT